MHRLFKMRSGCWRAKRSFTTVPSNWRFIWRSTTMVATSTQRSKVGWRDTAVPLERWFSLIMQRAIRRGSLTSVKALVTKIDQFVQSYNEDSTPFRVARNC